MSSHLQYLPTMNGRHITPFKTPQHTLKAQPKNQLWHLQSIVVSYRQRTSIGKTSPLMVQSYVSPHTLRSSVHRIDIGTNSSQATMVMFSKSSHIGSRLTSLVTSSSCHLHQKLHSKKQNATVRGVKNGSLVC